MSFRTGTQKYGTSTDEFVMIDGYNRSLALEEKLEHESIQADNLIKNMGEFNPLTYAVPSWWNTSSDYGWGFDEIPEIPEANGGQFHFSIGQQF